jgi:hypothetical protein
MSSTALAKRVVQRMNGCDDLWGVAPHGGASRGGAAWRVDRNSPQESSEEKKAPAPRTGASLVLVATVGLI